MNSTITANTANTANTTVNNEGWIFDNGGWKITTEVGYKAYYKNIAARENLREQTYKKYRQIYSDRVASLRSCTDVKDFTEGTKQLVADIVQALPPMLSVDKVLFANVETMYENIMILYFPLN